MMKYYSYPNTCCGGNVLVEVCGRECYRRIDSCAGYSLNEDGSPIDTIFLLPDRAEEIQKEEFENEWSTGPL